ncbi:uncharacterized protein LOC126745359 isoform X5 [Anthonomus grandis grandis]|uniref:uncharacterized protein LOC126745359 isoform X5 n=1 Tax=Anthonomus grandis grandis TaxID=2921223 RepID=UPI002165FD60|nr:uncharacterized protein LOC126745359 isoform X5 [Anthonomus grandis grandis]
MFAGVEFDNARKEFSVVPLTWITDDKTECFWPKTIRSEDQLQSMIQECVPPKASWNNYGIKKIHYTTESFDVANCMLKIILEESSSANEEAQVIQIKAEEIDRNVDILYLSSSDSDTSIKIPKKKKIKKSPPTPTAYNSDSSEIKIASSDSEQTGTASVESIISVGPRKIPSNVDKNDLNQWQQSISQELEHIKAVQKEQSTMLSQIWQALQVKNIQALQRPDDIPNLPLNTLKDFGCFEEWLKTEQNFIYMRARLASIGGTTVRAAVMNMMKFLFTNKLGMAFNWTGSAPKSPNHIRKYAFKGTRTYQIVNENTIMKTLYAPYY